MFEVLNPLFGFFKSLQGSILQVLKELKDVFEFQGQKSVWFIWELPVLSSANYANTTQIESQ